MPSGARKRKAAKKKKELEANNSHDQEDSKSQDDKGSDGSGEVSSPVHQDHHNTQDHPRDARSIDSEEVIEIQWSLKDESSSRSTSSRSSSDDEKKPDEDEEEEAAPPLRAVDEKESSGSLVAELSPVIEAVKPVEVPVSEETISYLETAPVDNLLIHEVIKSDTSVPENGAGFSSSGPKSDSGSKGYEDNKTVVSFENQIPVGLIANQIKKTSVFSCCGIFDLFSASSR